MTLSSTTTEVSYTGDGGTTAFPVTFAFFGTTTAAQLEVIERTIATGAEATLVNGTDYTVSGGNNATGTVTATSAPANTVEWHIRRNTTQTQGTDYVENDPFPAATHENALDRLTMIAQEQEADHALTFSFPVTYTGGASTAVPEPSASKVLQWNSAADALENGPTSTEISNAQTYASAASASAAAAAASSALASEWASKTDGQVASTDYSSKAWAIGGTGVTDTASAGAAKEWATAAEDDLVDGSEYSAKHYSAKASAQATAAANSAASAAASAQGFSGVTLLTASSNDVETTDARTYYQVDASSNTVAINLPSIGTGNDGLSYTVEVLDVSNAITLVRDGSDTINGVSGNYTGLVEVGQVIQIIADDGTPDNWIVVQTSALKVDDTTVELSGRTIQVKDNGITPAKVAGSIQDQSGTSYTLVLGDAFKTVSLDNASAVAVTVPLNSSVAFSTSDRIDFINEGAGQVTVSGASGVTINDTDAGSFTIDQYGGATIIKVGTDAWIAPNQTVA